MNGIGNDYILIDDRESIIKDEEIIPLAKRICERRFSIGADGLLLLQDSIKADVKMRIINSDGSEAEMCGNGIRCLAQYCYDNAIIDEKEFIIETLAGNKKVNLTIKSGTVKNVLINMGKPSFERKDIPMKGKGRCINESLNINDKQFFITCLSVGNPHCVIFVDDVNKFPVTEFGPKIENDPTFPNRVNVEFTQIINRKEIEVRVWERGVGETLACGTGACAAVVASNILGKIDQNVIVHLLGGDLGIEYDENIMMSGSAEKAFEGSFEQ
jgi:diaminopimelate epimerase